MTEAPPAASARARIASHVRRLRGAARWTQAQAAERCALDLPTFQRIERAELNITLATLDRLAVGLGVDVAVLLAPAPAPELRGRGRPPILPKR